MRAGSRVLVSGTLVMCLAALGQDKPGRPPVERLVAEAERIAAKTESLRKALPRGAFDPASLAKGRSLQELYAFVRDRIAYEPYPGIMKGAKGTLVSRRGNSADKALLLATLAVELGTSARLVRGTLDPSRKPAPSMPDRAADMDEKKVASLASVAGLEVEKLRTARSAAEVTRARFRQRLWQRVDRDLGLVTDLLRKGGVPAPRRTAPVTPKEHWWVRTEDGDLDPTIGRVDGSEQTVYDLKKLPDEAFHKLRIRMTIRRNKEEVVVLDVTFRTAPLFGRTIAVGNSSVDGLEPLQKAPSVTPEIGVGALASTTLFQPAVVAGEKTIAGHPFDHFGNKRSVKGGRLAAVRGLGAALGGAFGGGKPKTELTGCWTDFELIAPAADPVRIRRVLYEKGPSKRQRALDLLVTREILVLPGEISGPMYTDLVLAHANESNPFRIRMLRSIGKGIRFQTYRKSVHVNSMLYAFALARQSEIRRLCKDRFPGTVPVRSRPALISFVQRFIDSKPPKGFAGIDILHNETLASGPVADDWGRALPLAAGILDTALENEVNRLPGERTNTSVLLERLLLKGAKPELVSDLPGAVHVHIPGKPNAWFRIGRATGSALGYVEGGGGQAAAEYAEKVQIICQLKSILEFYADLFRCIAIGITYPLHGKKVDFQRCVFEIACGKLLDLATAGTDVDPGWLNLITQETISWGWGNLCKGISNEIFGKQK